MTSYVDYIEEHLRDYNSNPDVLKSDLLTRFLDGESLSVQDLELIGNPKTVKDAFRLLYETDLKMLRHCFVKEISERCAELKLVKERGL